MSSTFRNFFEKNPEICQLCPQAAINSKKAAQLLLCRLSDLLKLSAVGIERSYLLKEIELYLKRIV